MGGHLVVSYFVSKDDINVMRTACRANAGTNNIVKCNLVYYKALLLKRKYPFCKNLLHCSRVFEVAIDGSHSAVR